MPYTPQVALGAGSAHAPDRQPAAPPLCALRGELSIGAS